jgi:hypothetical protein
MSHIVHHLPKAEIISRICAAAGATELHCEVQGRRLLNHRPIFAMALRHSKEAVLLSVRRCSKRSSK